MWKVSESDDNSIFAPLPGNYISYKIYNYNYIIIIRLTSVQQAANTAMACSKEMIYKKVTRSTYCTNL